VIPSLLLLSALVQKPSPLEVYRKLEFSPQTENFEKGWKERVAAEFEVINAADLDALRAALRDPDLFVRSMAARALGIRSDAASADALAQLALTDPEFLVRQRAVEALGLLKLKPEVIEQARKQVSQIGVSWVADLAAGQLSSKTDDAALVRQAYADGIKPEAMDRAKVGRSAPDFTATTTEGTPFKLSEVLGKKPIVIYFAAYDG
jgi:hypothetical protein